MNQVDLIHKKIVELQNILSDKITYALNLIQLSGQDPPPGKSRDFPEFSSLSPTLYFSSSRDDLYKLINKSKAANDKKGQIKILDETLTRYENTCRAIERKDYGIAFNELCEASFHVGLLWAKYYSREGEPVTVKAAGAKGVSTRRERSLSLIETCRKIMQEHEYNGKCSAPQLSGFLAKKIVSDKALAQSLRGGGYSTNEEILAKKLQGLLYGNNDGKAFFEELKSKYSKS